MTAEQQFLTRLAQLAKLCRFDLDDELVAMYDAALSPIGYERLNETLKEIIVNRSTRDPFPSIREISETNAGSVPVSDAAEVLVFRCEDAVKKFGYPDPDSARHYIGETAWKALGGYSGWENYCTGKNDKPGVMRAQLKNRIQAMLRTEQGSDMVTLEPQGNPEMKSLTIHREDKERFGYMETSKEKLLPAEPVETKRLPKPSRELMKQAQLRLLKGEV